MIDAPLCSSPFRLFRVLFCFSSCFYFNFTSTRLVIDVLSTGDPPSSEPRAPSPPQTSPQAALPQPPSSNYTLQAPRVCQARPFHHGATGHSSLVKRRQRTRTRGRRIQQSRMDVHRPTRALSSDGFPGFLLSGAFFPHAPCVNLTVSPLQVAKPSFEACGGKVRVFVCTSSLRPLRSSATRGLSSRNHRRAGARYVFCCGSRL